VLIDSPRRTTPSWASGLPGHPLGTPSPLSPRGTSARSVPQGRPVIRKVLLSAPRRSLRRSPSTSRPARAPARSPGCESGLPNAQQERSIPSEIPTSHTSQSSLSTPTSDQLPGTRAGLLRQGRNNRASQAPWPGAAQRFRDSLAPHDNRWRSSGRSRRKCPDCRPGRKAAGRGHASPEVGEYLAGTPPIH
jgi:hypothetical protein